MLNLFSTYRVKYFFHIPHQIFFPPTVPKSESRATQQCKLALPPTWASTFWWFHKWFFEEIYCIIEEGQVLVRNSVLGQIDQNWEFWKQTQTEENLNHPENWAWKPFSVIWIFGWPPVKEYIDWKLYQLNCEMFGLSTSCLPMFSPSYCSCWGRCPPPCQPPPEPRGSAQPLVGNHLNSQEGRWRYPGNRQGKRGLSPGNPLAPQALEMFVF